MGPNLGPDKPRALKLGNRRFALFDLREAVLSISGVKLLQRAARARDLDACGDLGDLLLGGGPDLGRGFAGRVHGAGRLLISARGNGIGRRKIPSMMSCRVADGSLSSTLGRPLVSPRISGMWVRQQIDLQALWSL